MVLDTVAALSPSNRTYFLLNGKPVGNYSPGFTQSPGGDYAATVAYEEDCISFTAPKALNTTIRFNGVPYYDKQYEYLCFVVSYSKGVDGTGVSTLSPFIYQYGLTHWPTDIFTRYNVNISETGLNKKIIYKMKLDDIYNIAPEAVNKSYRHEIVLNTYTNTLTSYGDCIKLYAIYLE